MAPDALPDFVGNLSECLAILHQDSMDLLMQRGAKRFGTVARYTRQITGVGG